MGLLYGILVFVAVAILFGLFIKWLNRSVMCTSTRRMDGKTVIVTGANKGLGKETARQLAKRGARVILACRDIRKGEKAAEDIKKSTENHQVLVRQLDLTSKRSITAFTELIKGTEDRLDVLINNAAVFGVPYNQTEDGFEWTMMTNYLGHFLLTYQLLELLIRTGPSRVVSVSALLHFFAKLGLDDFMMEHDYGPIKAYNRSKLAQIVFTRELAQRLQGTRVTTYSLHPGVIATDLAQHFPLMKIPVIGDLVVKPLSKFLLKSLEGGVQTTLYCAIAEEVEHESGLYYSDCAVATPSSIALDTDQGYRLWTLSEELLGLDPNNCPIPRVINGSQGDGLYGDEEGMEDEEDEETELDDDGFEYID